jgi:hypothetical protein
MKSFYIGLIAIFIFLIGMYYNLTHTNLFLNFCGLYDNKFNTLFSSYLNSDLTWHTFIKDCGSKVITDNSAKANEIFLRKYYNHEVEWTGLFIDASVVISSLGPDPDHVLNINVRMIPSESLKEQDLYLSTDDNKYAEYETVLKKIVSGDAIRFKALFEEIGNEYRSHHLRLIHIEKIVDFMPKEEIVVLFQGVKHNITGHLKG